MLCLRNYQFCITPIARCSTRLPSCTSVSPSTQQHSSNLPFVARVKSLLWFLFLSDDFPCSYLSLSLWSRVLFISHRSETIWELSVFDRITSVRIILCSFIQVHVMASNHRFRWLKKIPLYICNTAAYAFICPWTCGLFPQFGYRGHCGCEQCGKGDSYFQYLYVSFGEIPSSVIARS